MADQVPVDLGRTDFIDLWQRFLHAVLAKDSQSDGHGLPDPLHRETLGDRHQHDGVRVPAGPLGTRGDGLPDHLKA